MAHNTFNSRQFVSDSVEGGSGVWVNLQTAQDQTFTNTIDVSGERSIKFRILEIGPAGGGSQVYGNISFYEQTVPISSHLPIPFRVHQYTCPVSAGFQNSVVTYISFDLRTEVNGTAIELVGSAVTNGTVTIDYLFGP